MNKQQKNGQSERYKTIIEDTRNSDQRKRETTNSRSTQLSHQIRMEDRRRMTDERRQIRKDPRTDI